MNDEVWNMAVEAHPELNGRKDVKDSPAEFVALVKILGEVKREEEKGNFKLSEYKDIDKSLRLIEESKCAAKTFSDAVRSESDNLMTLMSEPGYYAAQTLLENDFLPTDRHSMDNLLNTSAPLGELAETRKNITLELIGNIYSCIDCEIKNVEDIKGINRQIEQYPLSVMALMAVSSKNMENNVPQVKVFNAEDLAAKLNDPKIKELSAKIPLTGYGMAFTEAVAQASLMENMDKTRVLQPEYETPLKQSYREIG